MVKLNSLLIVTLLSLSCYIESGSTTKSIECEFCKKLFGYIYNLLDDDRVIGSIETALDNVCGQVFPGQGSATCEDYVNKYTPKIVDLIVHNTEPNEACSLLELCRSSDQSKSLLELIAEKIVEAEVHSARCNECLVDVDSLQSDLKLARQQHIPNLKKCCGQYPTPDGLCDSYIQDVGPIYDALASKLVPADACGAFGVCSPTRVKSVTLKRSTVSKIEPDCLLCKQVVKLVDQVINRQAKFDIEVAFDKVCNTIVPVGNRKACRKLVDKYTTQLINFIAKHTDPDEACIMIGLCKSEPDFTSDLESLTSKVSAFEDCDNCNKSVSWAAVTINGYASSLNGMLENTCLDYAHDYDLCKGYMADNFNSLTNELIAKTSSDYFCASIFELCPKKAQN